MPTKAGDSVEVTVDLDALLPPPEKRSYYSYKGSLTTPPCTETLLWHVLSVPMKVSSELIEKVTNSVIKVNPQAQFNTRWPQPLNGRTVYHYNAEGSFVGCPINARGVVSDEGAAVGTAEDVAGDVIEVTEEEEKKAADKDDNSAYGFGTGVVSALFSAIPVAAALL